MSARRLVVINQPTYLPQLYLWNRFSQADVVIWLDDVMYERVWQNTTVIRLGDRVHRLTVPTHGNMHIPINQVEIDQKTDWARKHLQTIDENYRRVQGFAEMKSLITPILKQPPNRLAELNLNLIQAFWSFIGLKAEQYRSSDFAIGESATQRLLLLCQTVGATAYLCGVSSVKDYLDVEMLTNAGIEVRLQAWTPTPYPQKGAGFLPNLSIVDLVANVGLATAQNYFSQG